MRPVFRALALVATLMVCGSAQANAMPWANDNNYSLLARDEALADVLKNFANAYDTPVYVSEKLSGRVNGHYPDIAPRELLDTLGDIHSFNWYFDGSALYFYRNDELENRLIRLSHLLPGELKAKLLTLGLWDQQYNWREIPESGLIYLAGPPRMVEVIAEAAEVLDQRAKLELEATYSIRFFPLQHASAHDSTVSFRQEQITIPGIATLLKRLVAGEKAGGEAQNQKETGVPKLKGKGLNRPDTDGKAEPEPSQADIGDKAMIEADIRSNTIVVYDLVSRMPLYERLIRALDQPAEQIEINVSIINIRANKIKDLGISWRASDSASQAVFGFGDMPEGAEPDGGGIGLAVGENALFSSVLSSGSSHLLARLNMLAENGDAQILSRPTVISTDNMEAILDNSSTFYVRVAGREEVDLFPVSVGSVLKVTPHVIKSAENNSIHLAINIEDGQQTQEKVDNIPIIQNSTITTRAVVRENESLMIGGYYFDTKVESESRVPVLSHIPVLGHLFRRTHTEDTRMARLFLISPRILANKDQKSRDRQANETRGRISLPMEIEAAGLADRLTAAEKAALARTGQHSVESTIAEQYQDE